MARQYTSNCRHCGGSGKTVNGAWLRARRERAGISLRGLAARVGVSPAMLSQIELGQRHAPARIVARYVKVVGA